MPMTINGFGTTIIGSRGDVGWGGYDAVEWFVLAMLPFVPLKCVHTFGWSGEQYRSVPIRWSNGLVARTFFSRWVWVLGFVAVALAIIGFVGVSDSGPIPFLYFLALALAVLAAGIGLCLFAT